MREFQTALMTALEGAWNTTQVHAVGDVPGTPVTPYLVASVGSGGSVDYRFTGESGSSGYRVAVQAVGKTTGEVGFAVEKSDAALLDKSLTVAGFDCTPCRAEASSAVIRDPDGGVYLTCTLTYTFTAYPA